jgi:hypothetical protein
MRLTLLLALALVLGACAPGTAFPFDSGGDWPETGGGPAVVAPPIADDFPPITIDLPKPPEVPPLEPPPPTVDPPEVTDPPECRVLILPPRAAIERITKCQGTPAELTRR